MKYFQPTKFVNVACVGLVCVAFSTLNGCKTPRPDRGFVQREWVTTFRELGIVPSFPPREDIFVGDVYTFSFDPNHPENDALFTKRTKEMTPSEHARWISFGMSSRFTRLDLSSKISPAYANTLSAPATPPAFNEILGNPAAAAATDEIEKQQNLLDELKKQISSGKDNVSNAERETVEAKQARDRADEEYRQANAAYIAKKDQIIDTSTFEQRLKDAKHASYEAALLVAKAKLKRDQMATEAEKDTMKNEILRLESDVLQKQNDVTRANEELTAARTQKVDSTAEHAAVTQAIADQNLTATALLAKEHMKANATAAQAKLEAEVTAQITATAAKLETAKAVQKALADAGVKYLYGQPAYALQNVYDLEPINKAEEATSSRVNRLRLVAFPEFSVVSITSSDLSALVPIDALGIGLNISSENVAKVSVKIPSAESYAISIKDLLESLGTWTTETYFSGTHMERKVTVLKLHDDFRNMVEAAGVLYTDPVDLQTGKTATALAGTLLNGKPSNNAALSSDNGRIMYFRFVTEVFYARAMDVGVFASKSFGGRLNVNDTVTSAQGTNASTTEATNAVVSVPASKPISTNALLSELTSRVAANQTLPGGSVQVLSHNESSVGIRRIFDRPVAVGTRGLVLTVDIDNFEVKGISVDHGMVAFVPAAPAE